MSGLLFVFGYTPVPAAKDAVIAVLPFSKISDFKHSKWKIEYDIPAFLLKRMINSDLKFIPFDSVRAVAEHEDFKGKPYKDIDRAKHVCRQLRADILILGEIIDFKVLKKTAVMPDIGGYKQYNAALDIKLWFYDRELED